MQSIIQLKNFRIYIILIIIFTIITLTIMHLKNTRYLAPNQLLFLGRTFCIAPWGGEDCKVKSKPATCGDGDDRCFYNHEYGVVSVSCERWFGAQETEMMTWDTRDTDNDRNMGHAESFDNYASVPQQLGHLVELGSGPFTQTQTIVSFAGKRPDSITLVEPMAFHYIEKVKHCFYKNGTYFENIPLTIISTPAEDLKSEVQFDTVVMINVIEHVYDALSILDQAVRLIKPGGIFIWHERLWNQYTGVRVPEQSREFQLHPIRLKSKLTDFISSHFQQMYKSTDTAELRRIEREGVYFIGRKRQYKLPESKLPYHPPCIKKEENGSMIIVFIVGNQAVQDTTHLLSIASKHDKVKQIAFVARESLDHSTIVEFVRFKKSEIFLSHFHYQGGGWKKEIKKFIRDDSVCEVEQNSLTAQDLESHNGLTLCVNI